MKTLLSSRRRHYVATLSIFLVMVALIAGMVGCVLGEYELTIDSTSGGEVIIPEEKTSIRLEGETVSLVAEADKGYRFVSWTGDVDDIADVEDASTTITVNGNYSITATFEEIPEYNLTISSTSGGNVTKPGEGTFTYNASKKVDLEAQENEGFGFVGWTGDFKTIANVNKYETSITMNGNYTITANFKEEDPVTFADSNLEAAIKEALIDIDIRKSYIYPSDLKRLTKLDTKERNISDLRGLEHCTGLKKLELYNNQIDDILPLANLNSLSNLFLQGNQISGVPPLPNLTSLTELNLEHNQISDISPLANLNSLEYLYLGSNNISDISPLANLNELTELNLEHNQISDISHLANLNNLEYLYLGSNNISDISHLANLTSLTELYLWSNNISDISHLANLTSLTKLDLLDNQISDIEPLVKNTGLSRGDEVDLRDNPLSDNSINIYIPELVKKHVDVQYSN